jgi:hypothetical protein
VRRHPYEAVQASDDVDVKAHERCEVEALLLDQLGVDGDQLAAGQLFEGVKEVGGEAAVVSRAAKGGRPRSMALPGAVA